MLKKYLKFTDVNNFKIWLSFQVREVNIEKGYFIYLYYNKNYLSHILKKVINIY